MQRYRLYQGKLCEHDDGPWVRFGDVKTFIEQLQVWECTQMSIYTESGCEAYRREDVLELIEAADAA